MHSCIMSEGLNPLTAGPQFIRFFNLYYHIKYQLILNKICDTNQPVLNRIDLHFVKSE